MSWLADISTIVLLFFGNIFGIHSIKPTSTPLAVATTSPRQQLSTTTQKIYTAQQLPEITSDRYFGYRTDGVHVYFNGIMLVGSDPATFRILDSSESSPYAKDNNHVWFGQGPMPEADPVSFRVLSGGYALDKGSAYYYGTLIKGSDPATFTPILDSDGIATVWSKDKNAAYDEGKSISHADAATFVLVPDPSDDHADMYAKDDHNVYLDEIGAIEGISSTSTLPDADPSTFKLLYAVMLPDDRFYFFGADKNRIYYDRYPMKNVDEATFAPIYQGPGDIWNGYSKDKSHVYHFQNIVPGANPANFVPPPITNWM